MRKNKILIIEDERMTVELLKIQLQDEGFDIIAAYDGEEGIKKAGEEKPTLIILDIMLPKLDGLDVCKFLKNDINTRNIPIVMLTCRTDMDVKLKGFQNGADDYIVKPFDQRELLARINSILRLIKLQNSLDKSREEIERISVINEINKAISSSLDLEEILKIIVNQTKRLIDYDLISIVITDKNEKFVKIRPLIRKNKIEKEEELYLPIEKSIVNKLKSKKSGFILNLAEQKIAELLAIPEGNKLLSAITVPLSIKGKIIGAFNIASYVKNIFTDTDLEVAEQIAPQVAIAIENSRLYEKVSESEMNYQQLFDDATDLIFLNDPETGAIVGANQKAVETLYYPKEELLQMNLSDIISASSSVSSGEILDKIKLNGQIIFETSYKRKDGSILEVEVSAKLIDFQGMQLLQGFARDITVRKKSEKELRFLANITTNSPLAIVGTDNDGNITSWNKGGEIIFGYKAEEIIGKPYQILVPEELQIDRNQLLQEALLKGILEEIESERTSKSGKRVAVKITYSVIKDDKGENIGIAYIIRNIEKEIELQRQLIQSEKLSTMGQLVSGVAHELNNPLTGIIGFSELLMIDCSEEIKDDLKRIHKEASRAKRIVQNLLSFARMHKPEKSRVDLNAIIDNVLELKSYEMKVDNINIHCELDSNLPITLGDPHQLQQVFLNIINNAHHAILSGSQEGTLYIKTYRKESTLFVQFRDTGPGISMEYMDKIFDPFFTTKDVGKGTGLGLSLSYGIIKDHGGYIQVWSKKGHGATFTIELPIIKESFSTSKLESIASLFRPSIKDYDILVIDDEDTVVELLREILTREGNRIEVARDGKMALEKITNKGFFDVIICDIKMPNMNACELYQLLREKNSDLSENFIFMSGAIASNIEYLNFFDQTSHPFLEKPFSVSDVVKAVNKIVSKNKINKLRASV